MKNILIVLLILIAIAMIILGISAKMIPPALTGIGFLIISILLLKKE